MEANVQIESGGAQAAVAVAPMKVLDESAVLKLVWQSLVKIEKKLEPKKLDPQYMNKTQACERYNFSYAILKQLMELPSSPKAVKIGTLFMLKISDWDEYIANFDNEREGIIG